MTAQNVFAPFSGLYQVHDMTLASNMPETDGRERPILIRISAPAPAVLTITEYDRRLGTVTHSYRASESHVGTRRPNAQWHAGFTTEDDGAVLFRQTHQFGKDRSLVECRLKQLPASDRVNLSIRAGSRAAREEKNLLITFSLSRASLPRRLMVGVAMFLFSRPVLGK